MKQDHFGPDVAAHYDERHAEVSTPAIVDPAVCFLAELAAGGRVLEFAIGTGRIGLPLHRRGLPVDGIDLSAAMLERLRAKAGAETMHLVEGDIVSTRVGRSYDLVYLVFNTINNLTTQDEQVACFQNAADHLRPGGHFVVEVGVPSLRSLPPGQRFHTFHFAGDRWGVDEYHFATQDFTSHHFRLTADRVERTSVPFRYVFPEELDLMARLAGLSRVGRWAGWERQPFTDDSTAHVSVWRKPSA